jgi:hypothetical protein
MRPESVVEVKLVSAGLGYDTERLGRDEFDERQLVGLKGVVQISHIVFDGTNSHPLPSGKNATQVCQTELQRHLLGAHLRWLIISGTMRR